MAGILVKHQTGIKVSRAEAMAQAVAAHLEKSVSTAWEVTEFGSNANHPTFFLLITFLKSEIGRKAATEIINACHEIMTQHAYTNETVGSEYQRLHGKYQESSGLKSRSTKKDEK